MFDAKAVDRGGIVVPDFLLLGIEPDSLADDGFVRLARRTPDSERHFETDDQRAGCVEVACARTECMLACQLVRGDETFLVGWDIAARGVRFTYKEEIEYSRQTVPYLL